MPPKASPICKFNGCTQPRHIYPGGTRSQYCGEHMKHRKAKSRDGLPSMTGQMRDILTYLRGRKLNGVEWMELGYPFAHGTTIKGLIQRDWIFESHGIDGSLKYKITGRGLAALKVYEPRRQRRDGLCPHCETRERHVAKNGRRMALCSECERKRSKKRRTEGKVDGDPQRPCSRCETRPRYQYPGGRWSTYCQHCAKIMRRLNNRRNQRRLLKAVQGGAPVPVCQKCKTNPRRVTENCVNKYCSDCQRENNQKVRVRRAYRNVMGSVAYSLAGN